MPISKLVDKLWETVGAKSLSALCKPGQIRREGIASIEVKRKEMLILAQTEKEIEQIKSGKAIVSLTDISNPKLISLEGGNEPNTTDLMEPYINLENLSERISAKIITDEIQKEINIGKSLLVAEQILNNDQSNPTQENIEDDWLFRWRDSAATSSSEKLQDLWGRVLAGELKTPGTYSLRTIEFIKNLTQKEALRIQKLFSYILFGRLIREKPMSDSFGNEHLDSELKFNFLSEMQSLGILAGAESMGLTTKFKSNHSETYEFHDIYNDKVMHVTHDDPQKILQFSVLILTPLGHELRSICPVMIDSTYINYVINIVKNQGFKVSIGDLVTHSNGAMSSVNQVEV